MHRLALSPSGRASGISDQVCSIGELLDAALMVAPREPTRAVPGRRRLFRATDGVMNSGRPLWSLFCGLWSEARYDLYSICQRIERGLK
jgi:hypothetical protein